MKDGLIRCMQTEDMCPGTTDFKVMKEKKCAFEGIEEEKTGTGGKTIHTGDDLRHLPSSENSGNKLKNV